MKNNTAYVLCENLRIRCCRFKSNFVVETRGAGAGQLTVRVRGPKGAFNVEMQVSSNPSSRYIDDDVH